MTATQAEALMPGQRVFVERIRRGATIEEATRRHRAAGG